MLSLHVNEVQSITVYIKNKKSRGAYIIVPKGPLYFNYASKEYCSRYFTIDIIFLERTTPSKQSNEML